MSIPSASLADVGNKLERPDQFCAWRAAMLDLLELHGADSALHEGHLLGHELPDHKAKDALARLLIRRNVAGAASAVITDLSDPRDMWAALQHAFTHPEAQAVRATTTKRSSDALGLLLSAPPNLAKRTKSTDDFAAISFSIAPPPAAGTFVASLRPLPACRACGRVHAGWDAHVDLCPHLSTSAATSATVSPVHTPQDGGDEPMDDLVLPAALPSSQGGYDYYGLCYDQ